MKKNLTLSIIVLIAIFALSVSCKKEKTNEEPEPTGFYIKFKIDGVQKQMAFTNGVRLISNVNGNSMSILVQEDIDLYPHIRFGFSNFNMTFNKGFVFTSKVGSDTQGFMVYNESIAVMSSFYTLAAHESRYGNTDFVFTLTDKTDTHVRGTFSGTVYNFGTTVQTKKITDGSFYLNIDSK